MKRDCRMTGRLTWSSMADDIVDSCGWPVIHESFHRATPTLLSGCSLGVGRVGEAASLPMRCGF